MERCVAGRYKMYQKLGSGAFGEIYYGIALLTVLGIDTKNGEEVAVKLV